METRLIRTGEVVLAYGAVTWALTGSPFDNEWAENPLGGYYHFINPLVAIGALTYVYTGSVAETTVAVVGTPIITLGAMVGLSYLIAWHWVSETQ